MKTLHGVNPNPILRWPYFFRNSKPIQTSERLTDGSFDARISDNAFISTKGFFFVRGIILKRARTLRTERTSETT